MGGGEEGGGGGAEWVVGSGALKGCGGQAVAVGRDGFVEVGFAAGGVEFGGQGLSQGCEVGGLGVSGLGGVDIGG